MFFVYFYITSIFSDIFSALLQYLYDFRDQDSCTNYIALGKNINRNVKTLFRLSTVIKIR